MLRPGESVQEVQRKAPAAASPRRKGAAGGSGRLLLRTPSPTLGHGFDGMDKLVSTADEQVMAAAVADVRATAAEEVQRLHAYQRGQQHGRAPAAASTAADSRRAACSTSWLQQEALLCLRFQSGTCYRTAAMSCLRNCGQLCR